MNINLVLVMMLYISYLPENITLIRARAVNKGSLSIDKFTDFYEKIIATKNNNDWIDGISNGGFIASLEIDLSYSELIIIIFQELVQYQVKLKNLNTYQAQIIPTN